MNRITAPTGENLWEQTFDSGFKIYAMEKPGYLKKYAVLSVNYGSIDSCFRLNGELYRTPEGIAHFLEHKLFEQEEGHVFQTFSRFGASVNAYTSYTLTSYLFSTIDFFPEALRELISFVHKPYLTPENVDKEKGIIEQELLMYDDHPDRRVHKNLLQALYHVHPLREDIGGTVESVRQIDVDWLMKCYEAFYQPQNMALFFIGDADGQRVIEQVGEELTTLPSRKPLAVDRVYPSEPENVAERRVSTAMNISRPRLFIGLKDNPEGSGDELLKQEIVMGMIWRLLAGKSSPFYQELYEQGIIDESFGAHFSISNQYAYSLIGGETNEPEKLESLIRETLADPEKLEFSDEDLERLKRKSYGAYIAAFNSPEYVANSYISHKFNGTSLFDFPRILQAITREDVRQRMAKSLDLSRSAVSILTPQQAEKG